MDGFMGENGLALASPKKEIGSPQYIQKVPKKFEVFPASS